MGIPETFKSKAVDQDPKLSSILISFHLRFKNAMKLSAASSRAEPTFSNFKKLKLKKYLWTGDLFLPFCLLPASHLHPFHFKQVF